MDASDSEGLSLYLSIELEAKSMKTIGLPRWHPALLTLLLFHNIEISLRVREV
jgi:hypothetical protein